MNALIEEKGRELLVWRSNVMRQTGDGIRKLEAATADLPRAQYAPLLAEFLDKIIAAARSALPTYVGSAGDQPELAEKLTQLAGQNVDAARYLRKQIARIDEVRAKQHDAHLKLIGMLREYRSRYEDVVQDGPLGARQTEYLNTLNKRYSVVNAKLAE